MWGDKIIKETKDIAIDDVVKWHGFLDKLGNSLKELRAPHTCNEWIRIIKNIIESLGTIDNQSLIEKEILFAALLFPCYKRACMILTNC